MNALQLYQAVVEDQQIRQTHPYNAAVVDVDGTLCDVHGEPIAKGVQFAQCHHRGGYNVLIVTAREERWRHHTLGWLNRHQIPHQGLWMRRNGDRRPDEQVKADIFYNLAHRFVIRAAIDDHPGVLATWKRLGIPNVVEMD